MNPVTQNEIILAQAELDKGDAVKSGALTSLLVAGAVGTEAYAVSHYGQQLATNETSQAAITAYAHSGDSFIPPVAVGDGTTFGGSFSDVESHLAQAHASLVEQQNIVEGIGGFFGILGLGTLCLTAYYAVKAHKAIQEFGPKNLFNLTASQLMPTRRNQNGTN